MSSTLRNLSNKILISLVFVLLFFPEKSVLAETLYAPYYTEMPTNGIKSYMSYTSVSTNSKQGYLQQFCETDPDGFRTFVRRYVIAVGSGTGASIGDFADVYLENGTVIECVVGDLKADKHTDESNLVGANSCCCEFMVDMNSLNSTVKARGDASYKCESWQSPVLMVKVIRPMEG